jgi:hypothetical protein
MREQRIGESAFSSPLYCWLKAEKLKPEELLLYL